MTASMELALGLEISATGHQFISHSMTSQESGILNNLKIDVWAQNVMLIINAPSTIKRSLYAQMLPALLFPATPRTYMLFTRMPQKLSLNIQLPTTDVQEPHVAQIPCASRICALTLVASLLSRESRRVSPLLKS